MKFKQREFLFRAWSDKYAMSSNFRIGQQPHWPTTRQIARKPGQQLVLNIDINWQTNCSITQYTGVKDSKGNNIFEGDIVEQTKFPDDSPSPRVIIFEDEDYRELIQDWDMTLSKPFFSQWTIDSFQYKVIGNIFETPELFKGIEI